VIDPKLFLRFAIDPACRMLSAYMDREMGADEARVELLAIAPQESGLEYRRQLDSAGNPIDTLARGWWQFEAGGGVKGVMTHSASKGPAESFCNLLYVPFEQDDVHEALAWNGPLAAVFARLLLYTDAAPLPAIGDMDGSWEYYLRTWRPGKPHPETWLENYELAVDTVRATPRPE
jgi:hypothetical protein